MESHTNHGKGYNNKSAAQSPTIVRATTMLSLTTTTLGITRVIARIRSGGQGIRSPYWAFGAPEGPEVTGFGSGTLPRAPEGLGGAGAGLKTPRRALEGLEGARAGSRTPRRVDVASFEAIQRTPPVAGGPSPSDNTGKDEELMRALSTMSGVIEGMKKDREEDMREDRR